MSHIDLIPLLVHHFTQVVPPATPKRLIPVIIVKHIQPQTHISHNSQVPIHWKPGNVFYYRSAYSLKARLHVSPLKCLFTESLTMRFTIEVPIHWKTGYVLHYCSACSPKTRLCVSLLKCLFTESQTTRFTIEVLIHWKPDYAFHYWSAHSLKARLCASLLQCLFTES